MEQHIFWSGRAYDSREHCIIYPETDGARITSTIVGKLDEQIYTVCYKIETNLKWEVRQVVIEVLSNDQLKNYQFQRDENNVWKNAVNLIMPAFEGCIDVDISVTPFTNTLPIKRLALNDDDVATINVLYFDLLEQELKAKVQHYRRINKNTYHFATAEGDFNATITVDDDGLVVEYPGLFESSTH